MYEKSTILDEDPLRDGVGCEKIPGNAIACPHVYSFSSLHSNHYTGPKFFNVLACLLNKVLR